MTRIVGLVLLFAFWTPASIPAQQTAAPKAPVASPGPSRPRAAAVVKPSYDSLISTIVGLIQAGKIEQAAPRALEAVSLAPDRYEGHLYLGIVRFRQHALADAEASLATAFSLAPGDRKPKVLEVADLVAETRVFGELMATAEDAERQGAKAKAARSYAAAWELFYDRVDVAAKALRGFVATGNDFEAARIWNVLTPAQHQANAELFREIKINPGEVATEIDRRRVRLQATLRGGQLDEAFKEAEPMAEADPTHYSPVVAALLFLRGNQTDAFRWATALKPEALIRMDLFSEVQMNQMITSPTFLSYLDDVVGGNRERHLETLHAAIERPRQLVEQIPANLDRLQKLLPGHGFNYTYIYAGDDWRVSITPKVTAIDGCNVTFKDEETTRNESSNTSGSDHTVSLSAITALEPVVRTDSVDTKYMKDYPFLWVAWIGEPQEQSFMFRIRNRAPQDVMQSFQPLVDAIRGCRIKAGRTDAALFQ